MTHLQLIKLLLTPLEHLFGLSKLAQTCVERCHGRFECNGRCVVPRDFRSERLDERQSGSRVLDLPDDDVDKSHDGQRVDAILNVPNQVLVQL